MDVLSNLKQKVPYYSFLEKTLFFVLVCKKKYEKIIKKFIIQLFSIIYIFLFMFTMFFNYKNEDFSQRKGLNG